MVFACTTYHTDNQELLALLLRSASVLALLIVVDRDLSPPPFLQRWHAITRVAGIHYWQAAEGLRALLAEEGRGYPLLASSRGVASSTGIGRVRISTTGKQQS